MPAVEVRSKRIGGATFQIPTEIRPARRLSIGIKWIIRFSRARSGKGMADKLSAELIAASKGEGAAVKEEKIPTEWLKQTELLRTLRLNLIF